MSTAEREGPHFNSKNKGKKSIAPSATVEKY